MTMAIAKIQLKMFKYLAVLILVSNSIRSQVNLKNDIWIICNKGEKVVLDSLNNKKGMQVNQSINKFNPVYGFLKLSMLFYQRIVSPQLSSDCVFEQSCSNYSKGAIKRYGLIKGVLLTGDRLTRCIPATQNETEVYLFNEQGKIIDSPIFYTFKKKKNE